MDNMYLPGQRLPCSTKECNRTRNFGSSAQTVQPGDKQMNRKMLVISDDVSGTVSKEQDVWAQPSIPDAPYEDGCTPWNFLSKVLRDIRFGSNNI